MSGYVRVGAFKTTSKFPAYAIANSRQDIVYNMKKAAKRNDKETYLVMLKLRGFVSKASREYHAEGKQSISLSFEDWKNGPKYVVRENGRFKAVFPR